VNDIIVKLNTAGIEYTNDQLINVLKLSSEIVQYAESTTQEQFKTVFDPIIEFLHNIDVDDEDTNISQNFRVALLACVMATEPAIVEAETKSLNRYTFNTNAQILKKIKQVSVQLKDASFKAVKHIDPFFLGRERTQVYFQFLKNSIINIGSVFPNMCITEPSTYKCKLQKYWGVSKTHNDLLVSMYARVFERIVPHYGKHIAFFKHIIQSSARIIELVQKLPFTEEGVFGFLLLEHCLLVVLNIYTITDQHGIQKESLYEEEEESRGRQPVNKIQAGILRDFILTLIAGDSSINVSYQDVVDSAFRLKEREKNELLSKLNSTADLVIDNHFKALRIGDRWGGGENVRGYDIRRFDQEVADGMANTVEQMEQAENDATDRYAEADGMEFDQTDYNNDFSDGDENDE